MSRAIASRPLIPQRLDRFHHSQPHCRLAVVRVDERHAAGLKGALDKVEAPAMATTAAWRTGECPRKSPEDGDSLSD